MSDIRTIREEIAGTLKDFEALNAQLGRIGDGLAVLCQQHPEIGHIASAAEIVTKTHRKTASAHTHLRLAALHLVFAFKNDPIQAKYKAGLPTPLRCPFCFSLGVVDRYPGGVIVECGKVIDYIGFSEYFCPACNWVARETSEEWAALRETWRIEE